MEQKWHQMTAERLIVDGIWPEATSASAVSWQNLARVLEADSLFVLYRFALRI